MSGKKRIYFLRYKVLPYNFVYSRVKTLSMHLARQIALIVHGRRVARFRLDADGNDINYECVRATWWGGDTWRRLRILTGRIKRSVKPSKFA